ncbi:hypothetical protein RRF57_011504 [Xylaria bambusicola]|uniref:Uncharacterized protein n=1 Tax=Xylaria bambusicola TaxID=326684 RepID=A0AAN7Z9W1_9PEZI
MQDTIASVAISRLPDRRILLDISSPFGALLPGAAFAAYTHNKVVKPFSGTSPLTLLLLPKLAITGQATLPMSLYTVSLVIIMG